MSLPQEHNVLTYGHYKTKEDRKKKLNLKAKKRKLKKKRCVRDGLKKLDKIKTG